MPSSSRAVLPRNFASWLVIAAVIVGFGMRLTLALTTIGTNDVVYWQRFMRGVLFYGSVEIYERIAIYNHPPLMSAVLSGLRELVPYAPNGFPFLIRLPAILADAGSCALVFRLLHRYWNRHVARIGAASVAASPILVSVSGFHGNTDPVFVFAILLAAERLLLGRATSLPGAALGVAMQVKIVPVLVVPAFFFWLGDWRRRIAFFAATGAVLITGYGYHLWNAWEPMRRNILAYGGLRGIWGVSWLAGHVGGSELIESYADVGRIALFLGIVGTSWAIAGGAPPASSEVARGRALLAGIGAAFLVFFVVTPGFGIQYLAWLAAPGLFLSWRWALGYNVLGGIFCFAVYTYWSRGFPWDFADSDVVGPWRGTAVAAAAALWLYLVAWGIRTWWAAAARRDTAYE